MKPLMRLFFLAGAVVCLSLIGFYEPLAKASDQQSQWMRCRQSFGEEQKITKKMKQALVDTGLLPDLPEQWPIVRIATHSYDYGQFDERRPKSVLLFADVPAPNDDYELINMNRWPAERDPPQKFLISDGSTNRSIVGVDLGTRSPLTRWLDIIETNIRNRLNERVTVEGVVDLLKTNVANFMGPVKNGSDGKADLPWDKVIYPLGKFFNPKLTLEDGLHEGKDMYYKLRIEPLESYFEAAQGYCLSQALANWLILRRFKIAASLVNGSTSVQPGASYGHTWVELGDGRILDSSLNILAWPMRRSRDNINTMPYFRDLHNDDWMFLRDHKTLVNDQLHDTWRFRYRRYPVLVLRNDPHVPHELKHKRNAIVETMSKDFMGAENETLD